MPAHLSHNLLGQLVWSKGSAGRVWRRQEGEGLATCVGPEVGGEAKGLVDVTSHQTGGCRPPGTPRRRGPASCAGQLDATRPLLWTSNLSR